MVLLWVCLVDGGNFVLVWGFYGGWVFVLVVCDVIGLIIYFNIDGNIWVGKVN